MTTGAETKQRIPVQKQDNLDVPDERAVEKSQIWVWQLLGRGGIFQQSAERTLKFPNVPTSRSNSNEPGHCSVTICCSWYIPYSVDLTPKPTW